MSTFENEKLEAKNLENENLEVIAPEALNSTEETVLILTEEQELLFQWGCEELFLDFAQKGINLECFKEMTENDINNLIPEEKYGLRIKFRTRLLEWRKANGLPLAALADTLTMNSSVMSWIKHSNFSGYNSPTSPGSSVPSFLPCQIGMKDGAVENSCSDIINKNLEEILKDSFIGKKILEIFEKKQPLSFKTRDELCDIIAHYWIINNYEHVLASQYCRQIVADIVKMFPKEDQEYYISSNKKIKGKLAQKYYSLSRKYREKGIIESRYKIKKQKTTIAPSTSNTSECNEEPYEIDEGMIGNQLWLKSNKQPEALVVDKWRSTFILRRKHLKEDKDIFFEWPILKQQIGVSLIELDFDELYPGKSQLLFSKWDNFKQKITEVYKKNIKDSASKKYFDLLSQEVSADSENYLFCILLTSILVPCGIHSTKEGAKFFWKPSILQAQSFMALHIETENNIHNVVEKHRENLLNRGLTNQPLIIIIGEIRKINKIFINLNNFLYEMDSFLKALSVIIQIFYTLNLEFPQPCKQAYEFIVSYFYDITLETKKSNQLIQLLLELKS